MEWHKVVSLGKKLSNYCPCYVLAHQESKQKPYLGKTEFDKHEIISKLVFKSISYDKKPHTNFFCEHFVVKTCQICDLLSFSRFFRAAQIFHSHVLATTFAMQEPSSDLNFFIIYSF